MVTHCTYSNRTDSRRTALSGPIRKLSRQEPNFYFMIVCLIIINCNLNSEPQTNFLRLLCLVTTPSAWLSYRPMMRTTRPQIHSDVTTRPQIHSDGTTLPHWERGPCIAKAWPNLSSQMVLGSNVS